MRKTGLKLNEEECEEKRQRKLQNRKSDRWIGNERKKRRNEKQQQEKRREMSRNIAEINTMV